MEVKYLKTVLKSLVSVHPLLCTIYLNAPQSQQKWMQPENRCMSYNIHVHVLWVSDSNIFFCTLCIQINYS